jgi:hypothetical protein
MRATVLRHLFLTAITNLSGSDWVIRRMELLSQARKGQGDAYGREMKLSELFLRGGSQPWHTTGVTVPGASETEPPSDRFSLSNPYLFLPRLRLCLWHSMSYLTAIISVIPNILCIITSLIINLILKKWGKKKRKVKKIQHLSRRDSKHLSFFFARFLSPSDSIMVRNLDSLTHPMVESSVQSTANFVGCSCICVGYTF